MDLFSGVDYYFFNLSFFQGGFVLLSSFWVFYTVYFSYFLQFKGVKILFLSTQTTLLGASKDKKGSLKGWGTFLWSMFIFIMLSKIFGLLPYVYGLTTKMYFVLFFSIWAWVSLKFSSCFSGFKKFFSHFCPLGSPLFLGGFLSVVEVVSWGIRPGTLTLRLVANMTTGHILMGLVTLSGCGLFFSHPILSGLVLSLLGGYVLFEVVICLIQGKVYLMLLQSYTLEHSLN